jgi:hypothetical protein
VYERLIGVAKVSLRQARKLRKMLWEEAQRAGWPMGSYASKLWSSR